MNNGMVNEEPITKIASAACSSGLLLKMHNLMSVQPWEALKEMPTTNMQEEISYCTNEDLCGRR
jgi:hypothetical protein